MNVEKQLQKDGIIVIEKIPTEIVENIANSVSQKIENTFPDYGLNANEIYNKLCELNMYKAKMPEGMQEASYCYKNSSIYFNSNISNEDLVEFAIHECIHYLQEVKDSNGKLLKMGLSTYSKFKTIGTGLNEAAVQYLSARIIGIEPDFEKYYNIDLFTPSPSYYPIECSLLNEFMFFIDEVILFNSTFFSTDDLKNKIIEFTSISTYNKIIKGFDYITSLEEKIILLNNKLQNTKSNFSKIQEKIELYKKNINKNYFELQNTIITEFWNYKFNQIKTLEDIDLFIDKLDQFGEIIGITDYYTFFDNFYIEIKNKLDHKANIIKYGGTETALNNNKFKLFSFLFKLKHQIFKSSKQKA